MTTSRIPIDIFERGSLPMIDFTTGEPADGQVELSASPRSGFAPLLILLGIVPYLIWAMTQPKPVFGLLPMTRASLDRLRRFDAMTKQLNRLGAATLVLGIVLIVVGSGRLSSIATSGVVFVVIALLVWFGTSVRPSPIRVDLDSNGRSIVLEAHPEFARLLARSMRSSSDRPPTQPVRPSSVVDELARLGDLHASGVIDDREFRAAKQKLLD